MAKLIKILSVTILIVILCSLLVQAQQNVQKRKKNPNQGLSGNKNQMNKNKNNRKPLNGMNQNQNKNKNKKNKNKNPMKNPLEVLDYEEIKNGKKGYVVINKNIPGLGKIRGRAAKTKWSTKAFAHFYDIPYAETPKRFEPPQPAKPWKDVLMATDPHPGCPSLEDIDFYDDMDKAGIKYEDCLRLSISSRNVSKMNEEYPMFTIMITCSQFMKIFSLLIFSAKCQIPCHGLHTR